MAKPGVSKLDGVKPGRNLRKPGGNCEPFLIRDAKRTSSGFTLIELMAATAIALMLFTLAIPLVRVTVQRERERELRHDLWEIRDAIDRYKEAADRGSFQVQVGSESYPPDLETLVKGVDIGVKKVRFL